jgi:DHA1 family multidrug resistance protein-like MFS transporter
VIPVFPFYIQSMGASGDELGLLIAISPFIQLIFSPIWGNVSDRIGRKPVLMAGILGYGLSMLFFGLATQLWMLYVIRGLGAMLSAATLPTTNAYVGDSTGEKERSGAMGILGAATGLGMMLGPALGGWLAEGSLSTPFFITAAVCLLTLILIALLLPESLPADARVTVQPMLKCEHPEWNPALCAGWSRRMRPPRKAASFDSTSQTTLRSALDACVVVKAERLHARKSSTDVPGTSKAPGTSRVRELWRALFGPLGVLLLLTALASFGLANFQGVFGLYGMQRFGFGAQEVGWIMTAVAVVAAVGQGLLTGPLSRRWGDVAVMRASLLLSAATFLLLLLADSFWTALAATALFVLPNSLVRVALTSLTSQRADAGQGVAMGLSHAFMSLGRIVGPLLAGMLFDLDIRLPYLVGAAAMAIGFVVSLRKEASSQPGRGPLDPGQPRE